MTYLIVLGILSALLAGFAIGIQSSLASRIGTLIGSFQTGILMNAFGGMIAGLLFVVLLILKGKGFWQIPSVSLIMLIISGALGILIVTGVSFSLQKIGVTAGLAIIILGQLLISAIIDAKGLGGSIPIPITLPRIIGLLVIVAGILLLLPKKG